MAWVHRLRVFDGWIGESNAIDRSLPALGAWILKVRLALEEIAWKHPFLAFGYDWPEAGGGLAPPLRMLKATAMRVFIPVGS